MMILQQPKRFFSFPSLWLFFLLLQLGDEASSSTEESSSYTKNGRRPNFVFFFPDTIRAESLGIYKQLRLKEQRQQHPRKGSSDGYSKSNLNVSPNFDTFATSPHTTLFEQCHVMHTQCGPSRSTMMTGRYMHVLGHRTQTHLIQAYETNYWRLLKDAGYNIIWLGKNDALSPDTFNKSITYWNGNIGYDSGINKYEFGQAGYYSMLYTGGRYSGKDPDHSNDLKLVLEAIEHMKDHNHAKENTKEKQHPQSSQPPFAIFIASRGAHPPYGAPIEFQNQWSIETIRQNIQLRPKSAKALNKPRYDSQHDGIPYYRNLTTFNDTWFYGIQKSYLEMISYTDYTFGLLLDGITKYGLDNSTVVIASSDHGDFAGDFGLIEKWPGGADDVLTRVPLAIRFPPGLAATATTNSSHDHHSYHLSKAPVQTADIMETMIDWAGIHKPDWVRFGISLKKIVEDRIEGDLNRFVYSEGGFYYPSELSPGGSDHIPPNNPRSMYWPRAQQEMSNNLQGSPKWVMIRNLTSKLVYRPTTTALGKQQQQQISQSELYDLLSDPREMNNLWGNSKYSQLRSELMEKLMDWLIITGDVPTLKTDPRGVPIYPHAIDESSCSAAMDPEKTYINSNEATNQQEEKQPGAAIAG